MSRGTKRAVIVIMVLISVFLIISPSVFSRTFVKIDLTGLKNIHVRADIYEETGGSLNGPKHGRIQVIVREAPPLWYNYTFKLDLRKVSKNTGYRIWFWTDLPDINITLHGDGSFSFWLLEVVLVGIGVDKYGVDGEVVTSLERLGLDGYHEHDTGKDIVTDNRGFYKNNVAGSVGEMEAIEWLIDFGSPILKQQLINSYPGYQPEIDYIFGEDRDFADFHIIGVTIPGGEYEISMGAKFINETVDRYSTEEITFTHIGNLEWWAP